MTTIRSVGAIFCLTLAALAAPVLATPSAAQERTASLDRPQRTDRTRLAASEIEASPASTRDLFEAIRSLRPHWLRTRGDRSISNNGRLQVYINGMQAGGVEELRKLDARSVSTVQYMDAATATMQFGTDHGRGAIMVTLR